MGQNNDESQDQMLYSISVKMLWPYSTIRGLCNSRSQSKCFIPLRRNLKIWRQLCRRRKTRWKTLSKKALLLQYWRLPRCPSLRLHQVSVRPNNYHSSPGTSRDWPRPTTPNYRAAFSPHLAHQTKTAEPWWTKNPQPWTKAQPPAWTCPNWTNPWPASTWPAEKTTTRPTPT